jgi:hypothetical protein
MKSFNRLPRAGIPLIQLNMRVGGAKTDRLASITDTASGEPTFTDKGYKTSV